VDLFSGEKDLRGNFRHRSRSFPGGKLDKTHVILQCSPPKATRMLLDDYKSSILLLNFPGKKKGLDQPASLIEAFLLVA
jgi:hypothetical protein